MTATVLQGDCIEVLRTLPDCSVDAVVTDPPYGLSFMGRKWDYDVPSVEIWAECLRVLKPGGHLLAFAGTRTQHRMCCRIEDAGFEIRDMIAWVYGSGFPKSMDVSKAIDNAAGAIREVIGPNPYNANKGGKDHHSEKCAQAGKMSNITAPATAAAKKWHGWGTALKPAMEPITVARKPLGTCATNVLEMIESELRERGVRGEILWKQESASGVARSRKRAFSGSTRHSEQPGTYAKTADENETQNGAHLSQRSSGQLGTSGPSQTQDGSESLHDCTTRDCENQSSLRTVVDAHVAENESETSSRSTTSTAEGHSTESVFTERSTPNLEGMDSPLDTESFAGIATGLTGSTAIVRISRDSEGFFLWPNGLPKFVNGSPLTVAENVLTHGTGAINVDGCRVASGDKIAQVTGKGILGGSSEGWSRPWKNDPDAVAARQQRANEAIEKANSIGRWPANLIHNGSEEVLRCFPAQAGASAPASGATLRGGNTSVARGKFNGLPDHVAPKFHNDSGSAARFFFSASFDASEMIICSAKAIMDSWNPDLANTVDDSSPLSRSRVDSALNDAVTWASLAARVSSVWTGHTTTVTPRESARLVETVIAAILSIASGCSPAWLRGRRFQTLALVSSVELGGPTGTTKITIDRWKSDGSAGPVTFVVTPPSLAHGEADFDRRLCYCAKASKSDRDEGCEELELRKAGAMSGAETRPDRPTNHPMRTNHHPTVKPTDLMRYLCRLVTPPGGVVLDPFMGSGSTGKAAVLEGFRFVGIEREAEYVEIAKARIASAQPPLFT